MQNNPVFNFDTFIAKLLDNKIYIQALKSSSILYKIDSYKISNITPNKMKNIYLSLKNRQNSFKCTSGLQEQIQRCDDQCWKINQLKLFVWVVVCYSYLTEKNISQFEQIDWSFLRSVFTQKASQTLEYQAKTLIRSSRRINKFSQEESELLSTILSETQNEYKWSQISKTLYLRSNKKFLLSPHKCREHWFNHLNKKILHGQWSADQDIKILDQAQKIGFKWSKISKLMGGQRTQHMVKNRFNSIISKWRVKHMIQPTQKITKRIINKIKLELMRNQGYLINTQEKQLEQSKPTMMDIEQLDSFQKSSEFFPCEIAAFDLKQIAASDTVISQKYNQCQMVQIDESAVQRDFNSKSLLEDLDEIQAEPFQSYLKFW